MNCTEIITQTMARVMNISATDADNTDTRARVLEGLTEVAGYVWSFRDWEFRRRVATVTVGAADGGVDLPTDFLRVGDFGGVFLVSTGARLEPVSTQELVAISSIPGSSTGNPTVYALYDFNDDLFRYRINIPTNSGAVPLSVAYEAALGTLDETATAAGPPVVPGGLDNIKTIPPVWHQTVIMPGLRAMFRQQLGDGRYQDFRQDPGFRMGLKEMVKWERHGDETTRSLPSFFGSY